MELVERFSSLTKSINQKNNNKFIKLPFSLMIYKNAIRLKIPGDLVKSLHFIDLQILIFSIEIDEVQQYIEQKRKNKLREKGIKEIRQASQLDFDSL